MLDNMFYGDFRHTENPLTFLKMLEEALEAMPHLSESKKCEYFYLHCRSGFNAETWYENLAPPITTSWTTLVLHFRVKWLRANPKILLEVPEIPPPTFCTATTTPTAIGRDDASRHLLPPATSSQPLDNVPTSPKLDPITPKTTQTDIKRLANETKPETAVATTGDVTIGTNAKTQNGMERRVNGEGRKEEEEVRTVFEDTREEVRGEEETGGEEEAKTGGRRDRHDGIHADNVDELDELKYDPNEREHEPQRLTDEGSGDRASMPKEPEFDDDGDVCGLERVTNSVVEPQGPHETPHNAPAPANDETAPGASERHPPTTSTSTTAPLSPARHTFTTTTTSGITGPAYDPTFVHPAFVDSPRDPAATGHPDPATLAFATPTSTTCTRAPFKYTRSTRSTRSRLMPPCIPPTAPVHVDPVAIAATATGSNPATATLTGFAFAMLSCRRAASFWSARFRGGLRRF